jgi:hypothetical protein
MTYLRFVLIIGLVFLSTGLIWRIIPAKSKLLIIRDDIHFPVVSGFNLNRQELELPRDFGGELNLVIVAFKQHQQLTVNTWIPFAQEIEGRFPGFIYYELPTIYEMPGISRTFINEGMRAGIPDQTARERTITLYLDKEGFKSALDIPNENDIYLLLVEQNGNILWRTTGEYTENKASELFKAVQEYRQSE